MRGVECCLRCQLAHLPTLKAKEPVCDLNWWDSLLLLCCFQIPSPFWESAAGWRSSYSATGHILPFENVKIVSSIYRETLGQTLTFFYLCGSMVGNIGWLVQSFGPDVIVLTTLGHIAFMAPAGWTLVMLSDYLLSSTLSKIFQQLLMNSLIHIPFRNNLNHFCAPPSVFNQY